MRKGQLCCREIVYQKSDLENPCSGILFKRHLSFLLLVLCGTLDRYALLHPTNPIDTT